MELRPLVVFALAPVAAAQEGPPSVAAWAQMLQPEAWAVSLSVERTSTDGLIDSRDEWSPSEIFGAGFDRFTRELLTTRTTLHVAHGLEGCTIYASLPLLDFEREGSTSTPSTFSQSGSGVGDLVVGLTKVWREDYHWSVALSLPTGSVDETDGGELLPYAMQPGTGTFDLLPGVAWGGGDEALSWGLSIRGRLRIGDNDEGWAHSNSHVADFWVARELDQDLVARLGLRNSAWGDVHGTAAGLQPTTDPLENDDRQGGTRNDAVFGLEYALDDTTLALEAVLPLSEWLDGPAPKREAHIGFSIRYGW